MYEAMVLSVMCTSIFITFKHPLVLVGTLTMQTMPVFFVLHHTTDCMWSGYMLFLIFLGGLLVIFIYLAALIPNEVFLFRPSIILLLLATLLFTFMIVNVKSSVASSNSMILLSNFSFSYMSTFMPLGLLYLLAGLYSAMYICENTKTPLKTNTYE